MADNDDELEQEEALSPADIPAAQWRHLRLALIDRVKSLVAARDAEPEEVEKLLLQQRIDALKEQVGALAVEESVAQFVEDAARYTAAASALDEELLRDPDSEIA
jgi:hypothetical protein